MAVWKVNQNGANVDLIPLNGANQVRILNSEGGEPSMTFGIVDGAVNNVTFLPAVSGQSPIIEFTGEDGNVSGQYQTKGAGFHSFQTLAGSLEQFRVAHTGSAGNYAQATGAALGSGPTFSAQGGDANIDLNLAPKGTGNVRFGTFTASGDVAVTGSIEIKDAAGTVRKLATIA